MSDPVTFRINETVRYNHEVGELQTLVDDVVRETIRVRASLMDDLVLQATIIELNRLGYMVIRP